jgi:hypothetical protein
MPQYKDADLPELLKLTPATAKTLWRSPSPLAQKYDRNSASRRALFFTTSGLMWTVKEAMRRKWRGRNMPLIHNTH